MYVEKLAKNLLAIGLAVVAVTISTTCCTFSHYVEHVTDDLFYSLDTIFQWNEYYRGSQICIVTLEQKRNWGNTFSIER